MLSQEQIDQIVNESREAGDGPTAFARRIETVVRRSIADDWDGCIAEAVCYGEVDVGASIRAGSLVDA